jgi:hypothetical protein
MKMQQFKKIKSYWHLNIEKVVKFKEKNWKKVINKTV